jgi:hypothetical protein
MVFRYNNLNLIFVCNNLSFNKVESLLKDFSSKNETTKYVYQTHNINFINKYTNMGNHTVYT